MTSLPSSEQVDKGPLTLVQYEALLMSGAASLCPSLDWDNDTVKEPLYAYRTDAAARDITEKLIIATDDLHRLREKNPKRRGLILVQQTQRDEVPPLRMVMLDPTNRNFYDRPSGWRMPSIDIETRTCLDESETTRMLGRRFIAKYSVVRVRRLVSITADATSFSISKVYCSGSESIFEIESPPSLSIQRGHVIQIKCVHPKLDGWAVVTSIAQGVFRVMKPRNLYCRGVIYTRKEGSPDDAKGNVAYSLCRERVLYHLRFLREDRLQPPPSPPAVQNMQSSVGHRFPASESGSSMRSSHESRGQRSVERRATMGGNMGQPMHGRYDTVSHLGSHSVMQQQQQNLTGFYHPFDSMPRRDHVINPFHSGPPQRDHVPHPSGTMARRDFTAHPSSRGARGDPPVKPSSRGARGDPPVKPSSRGARGDPPFNPFTEMQRQEATTKLNTEQYAGKSLLSVLFDSDHVEASLRRLARRFGWQNVKDAFDATSSPSDAVPGCLLLDLQQRRSLIQTSHQRAILTKIGKNGNWLFRLPEKDKVATYLEIIRLLMEAESMARAVILTSSRAKATDLLSVLQIVQGKFGLRRLKSEKVLGGDASRIGHNEGTTALLDMNVVITTPAMFENMLSHCNWNLTHFRVMIWDDCEKITEFSAGNCIMRRYRQLENSAQSALKVYAFTSYFHVPEAKLVRVSDLCNNLSIPLRHLYVISRQGHVQGFCTNGLFL